MSKGDVSAYILEANRIQGSIAERERTVKVKKEEFAKLVQGISPEVCEQLERQYGISLRKFMEADLDGMSTEEWVKLKEEAEATIERIKVALDRTFRQFRGE